MYWLTSTILLALGFSGVLLVTLGTRQGQLGVLREMEDRLREVERRVKELAAQPPGAAVRPLLPEAAPLPQQPPAPAPAAETRSAPPPAVARGLTADEVLARLQSLTAADPVTLAPGTVIEGAGPLIQECIAALPEADWPDEVWLRLAVVARAALQEAAAERFAGRLKEDAARAEYQRLTARALLARGRFTEARAAAASADLLEPSATTQVLLATASVGEGDLAEADVRVAQLPAPEDLTRGDRLLLARVLATLERWEELAALVDTVLDGGPALEPGFAFFAAVARARGGRPAEALAILDALAAGVEGLSPEAWGGLAGGVPSAYEIELWRGVSLLFANQTDAARGVLRDAAQQRVEDGTGHYYLGLLESRAGRPRLAEAHWRNAVAADPGQFAAWEGLATVLLEEGEVQAALEHAERALELRPRRAAAHFLRAVILAQLDRAEDATRALTAALQLDPAYLDEAQHTSPLLRLLTPKEMAELAKSGMGNEQ